MRPYLLLALAALPLAACSAANSESATPSGAGNNRAYAIAGFNRVIAAGPDDVDIRMGASFSVRAEGDPKALDQLEIVKVGDTLEIRRKPGFRWNNNDHGAKIYVTMPAITAASTTGPGDLAIDKVEGDTFKVSSTGPGDVSIGAVKLQSIAFSVTGPGSITVAGTAKTGDLSVTGPGDIDAPGLSLSSAAVSVMGPGGVKAAVNGPASVNVMGPGNVTLTGGAKCTTNKMGPGSVDCS